MRLFGMIVAFVTPAVASATVEVQSIVNDGTFLHVTYSKDFATCAHLVTPGLQITHTNNWFCAVGTGVVVSAPLSDFHGDVGPGELLQLCHGNNYGECSAPAAVEDGRLGLAVRGACPGMVSVGVNHATPGGNVGLVTGAAAGTTPVPGGPCAGTLLGLGGNVQLRVILRADAQGRLIVSPNLPAGVCGQRLQVVDLSTCRVSPVGQL